MVVKICLYITIFSALTVNLSSCTSNRITVIGTALNTKPSAIVKTDYGHYYIDGLDSWVEKYHGKKVKVTGILVIEHHEKQSSDSMEVQEIVGKVSIIKKPKWSLVE